MSDEQKAPGLFAAPGNVLPPRDAELVSQFLGSVAKAKGIERSEAEQVVLLDAAVKWHPAELVAQFLEAVAKAKGIERAEAQQVVLLAAAVKWQSEAEESLKTKPLKPVNNSAPISSATLMTLLIITGVLAILAAAIFVLVK